jgi:putative Ig domain-containing protein
MRFRFFYVLTLLALVAAAFAGVAQALDFDDEDPNPPHPEIGLVYHYEIGTHAGCLPHHLVILSGALPPGLTLTQMNDHTGLVSGVATQSGTFSVWLGLKDCENRSAETLFTFDVWDRRFGIDTKTLPAAVLGSSYSTTLTTYGIPSNTSWQVTSGSLPAGLTLSSAGVISGTPTAAGSSTFTVGATGNAKDFTGLRVDSRQFTLAVTGPLAVRLSRPALEVGVSVPTPLAISGGQAPFTVSATGLPAGLAIGTDGVITGAPRKAGSYLVTVHLVDAGGSATNVQLRLVIRAKLGIATKRLPTATAGRRYSAHLGVRGGVPALRWSLAGGSLPRGVTLARTGAIAGTPQAGGSYRVTFRVRDALGVSVKKTLVLSVR